ncbi:MAG: AAA family ATPase [candidate division Zixibacteria bacterium]|nr:AAA family ATPase [candidate division Zixibacteria bacterium]
MRVEKLGLKRFGKFDKFEIRLSKGINLIKGDNEAGKSTLVEALTCALYDDPKSTKKELKDKTSWGFQKDFEMKLDFEAEGNSYSLEKDFDSGFLKLSKTPSGESWEDKKSIEEIINQKIGIPTKEVFLATACVQQDEISRLDSSVEAIKDKLESLVTGGEEKVKASKIIEHIKEKMGELKKVGTKNLGIIQKYEKDREELTYELEKVRNQNKKMRESQSELTESSSRLGKISKESEVKKELLEKAEAASGLEEKQRELEERFHDLNTRIKQTQNSERVVRKLREEASKYIAVSKEDKDKIDELEAKLAFLEEKKNEWVREEEELKSVLMASSNNRTLKILALSALGLTLLFGFLAYFLKPVLWGGAGFTFILLLVSVFKLLAQKSERHFYSQQIEQKRNRLQELERDSYELTTSAKNILSKYNLVSSQVLRENYDHYRDIEREIKNELSRYEGWLGGRNARDLESELKDVTRELALWDEKTRDLKPFILKREELIQLQNEVREIEEKKKNLEIKTIALKKELEMAECGAELEASLEERLDYTHKSLMELQKGLEIYEIIQGTLEEARRKVIDTCVGTLEEETSKLLQEMTAGKYSQVRFDKESFRFEVFSDKLKDWVDPQKFLSRGTLDQIYLACRLALLNLISEDKNPVVIMDDPFVTFDKHRRKNALKLLKSLSKKYQILLLTCHDFYDGYEDQLIELPA